MIKEDTQHCPCAYTCTQVHTMETTGNDLNLWENYTLYDVLIFPVWFVVVVIGFFPPKQYLEGKMTQQVKVLSPENLGLIPIALA